MASRRVISNVDWQIGKKSNAERAKYMFETSLHCDCEFRVGGDNEEREVVKAHKIFLALGSPVFETMFYGGMAQALGHQSNPIDILDMQPSAFKDLLEYIYTERVELKSFDQACELYYAAKKYMIPNLVENCSQFLCNNLNSENVCRALEFANLYEDITLKDRSLNFIRYHTRKSFLHPEFEDITESTLLILVKEDDLNISEMDLFEAVKRWGSRECARREIAVNGANLRQVLSSVVAHIRFLAMTSTEFADSPAMTGILTPEESLAVLMNLSSREPWPMPPQLSSSRLCRIPYYLSNLVASRRRNSVEGTADEVPATSSGRNYCYRPFDRETLLHNTGTFYCAVALTVDRNICIQGIVISSQASNRTVDSTVDASGGYKEMLRCQLSDADGTYLTGAHFSGRSRRDSTLNVFFDRPVYLQCDQEYRIRVVVKERGYYPLGTGNTGVQSHGVNFRFAPTLSFQQHQLREGMHDEIIRGIIYSF